MVVFVTGVPGSGKSVLAVNEIVNNIDSNKYDYIYLNINQFKFELSSKLIKLDWDDFYSKIKELYTLSKDKNKSDDDLKSLAKELKIYNILFVLDECHNNLSNRDAVLIWWLSYHRHYNQDIWLITQNLALVESKYKSFAELFYRAVPSFLRLKHTKLKYFKYVGSRMSKADKFGVKIIDVKKNNLFNFFVTGGDTKNQNIILKYISLAVAFFSVLGLLFYFFVSSKTSEPDFNSIEIPVKSEDFAYDRYIKQNKSKENYTSNIETNLYKDYKYFTYKCIFNKCEILEFNKSFILDDFIKLVELTKSKLFSVKKNDLTGLVEGSVLFSPQLLQIFGGFNNEEKNSDTGIINRFSTSSE